MMLSIQIAVGVAAGIVLAYLVIFHGRAIVTGMKNGLETLLSIAIFAACGYAIIFAGQTVWEHSEWMTKAAIVVGYGLIIIIWFSIAGLSAYGLRLLFYRLRGQPYPEAKAGDDEPLYRWGMLNFMIVGLATFGLAAIGADGWLNAVDRFGRANGMKDGLSFLLIAVLMLWPFVVLGAMRLARRNSDDAATLDASQAAD